MKKSKSQITKIINTDSILASKVTSYCHVSSATAEQAFEALDPVNIDFSSISFIGSNGWEGAGAIINNDPFDPRKSLSSNVVATTSHFRPVIWLMAEMANVIGPDYLDKYRYYPLIAASTNSFLEENPEPQVYDPEYTAALLKHIYDNVYGEYFGNNTTDTHNNQHT